MKVFTGIDPTREFLEKERNAGKTAGFVPTMGALHEGHLSLIRRSAEENDLTVCSIFVNPIQFNNKTDLEKYPRNLEKDLKMLDEAGCDVVFVPSEEEMYPGGKTGTAEIELGYLDQILEAAFRPGHFNGVVIVVKKLFRIIEPDKAYFGKKDYQQLMVIREMTRQLRLPVEIIPCEIIREQDGLAMSSRNQLLTKEERQLAPEIFRTLTEVKFMAGSSPAAELVKAAARRLSRYPEFSVEYLTIANNETLLSLELDSWDQIRKGIVLAAVKLNNIRLIDNVEFIM